MIRILLIAAFVLITFLIIGKLLASKNRNRPKILSYFIAIIIVAAIIGFSIWLLPRLGINVSGFLQRILPLINTIRGFLPLLNLQPIFLKQRVYSFLRDVKKPPVRSPHFHFVLTRILKQLVVKLGHMKK